MRPKESEIKVKNPRVNLKKDDVGVGCIAPLYSRYLPRFNDKYFVMMMRMLTIIKIIDIPKATVPFSIGNIQS